MTVIRFDIHVSNPEEATLLFDRIQVFKSPNEFGVPSPFKEITANTQTSGFVDGSIPSPWNLSGEILSARIDSGPSRSVTFEGTNPISIQNVLAQLNEQSFWAASEVPTSTGRLRLSSTTAGTNSSVQIISSQASAILGLSTEKSNGQSLRPLLSKNAENYVFYDLDGSEDDWYKIRYINTTTEAVSAFSEARRGVSQEIIPAASLIKCFAYFSDASGAPIVGRRIILVPINQVQLPDGDSNVYSILPSVDRISLVTDEKGYTEINLVRGMTMKMFIEGTPFQREFTIPQTGASVNLMTLASTQPDPFSIVTYPPFSIRMS